VSNRPLLFGIVIGLLFSASAKGDQMLLALRGVSPEGLAIAEMDLTAAAAWCKVGPVEPHSLRVLDSDDKPLESQFIPAADFDSSRRIVGRLLVRIGSPGDHLVRVQVDPNLLPREDSKPFDGRVTTPFAQFLHDPARQGGLPSSILFTQTNKAFNALRWGDRLHDRSAGSFQLSGDARAVVRRISTGPICAVVRVRASYTQRGRQPDSNPSAVYDWHYFHDAPLVFITASIQQKQPRPWTETHFLELTTPEQDFLHWAGGDPDSSGVFTGAAKTFGMPR
jgi:hypothetical protein